MIHVEGNVHSHNYANMTTCLLEETVSGKISLDTEAPDFSLNDYSGKPVKLSDYRGKHNVVLVFNRGFM